MKSILGARIRARRRSLQITQAELAKKVGISPSYLNLIEHNKRQIGGALLGKLAVELGIGLDELDGAAERRLIANIEEIAHLPDVTALGAEADRAGELIGRFPGWARSITALAHSSRENETLASTLADRLIHDAFLGETIHKMLSSVSATRSAAEILAGFSSISDNERDQFHNILVQESRNLTQFGEAISAYLDRSDSQDRIATPLDEVETLFERAENHFPEIENLVRLKDLNVVERSRLVQLTDTALLQEPDIEGTIGEIIRNHTEIETEIAMDNARRALLDYLRVAATLPLDEFLVQARGYGYDLEVLSEMNSVNVETICHRLASLPPSKDQPQFGYMQANAAGTIIISRNLPGLISPRYGFACPLWALYRAQQSPESIIRQRTLFPDGNRYVFLARARLSGTSGFGKPRHYLTDMLTVSENDAADTVYAPDQGVPVERVGISCRSCPRKNCSHRVSDPFSKQVEATTFKITAKL